jgi:hypothetical protein
VLANPRSTTVITAQDASTYYDITNGLMTTGVITSSEAQVMFRLGQTYQSAMVGMNRAQAIAYMDQPALLTSVRDAVIAMPALRMFGDVRPLTGLA